MAVQVSLWEFLPQSRNHHWTDCQIVHEVSEFWFMYPSIMSTCKESAPCFKDDSHYVCKLAKSQERMEGPMTVLNFFIIIDYTICVSVSGTNTKTAPSSNKSVLRWKWITLWFMLFLLALMHIWSSFQKNKPGIDWHLLLPCIFWWWLV